MCPVQCVTYVSGRSFISSIELAVVVRWVADQREARRAQFCALPALPSPRSRHLRRDERKITKDLFAAGREIRKLHGHSPCSAGMMRPLPVPEFDRLFPLATMP